MSLLKWFFSLLNPKSPAVLNQPPVFGPPVLGSPVLGSPSSSLRPPSPQLSLLKEFGNEPLDSEQTIRFRKLYQRQSEFLPLSVPTTELVKGEIVTTFDQSQFKIKKHLAKGCFGNLYVGTGPTKAGRAPAGTGPTKATDPVPMDTDPALIVLKTINKKLLFTTPEAMSQIYNERAIHQKVNHVNIISFLGAYEDAFRIYMVTPYGGWNDFYGVIYEDEVIFGEEMSLYIFSQLLSAIMYLHGHGIYHRDLKLENLLYDQANKMLKVIDFGLSTRLIPDYKYSNKCGTMEYMAPEIFDGCYDYRAEYWAMGVILYECLFRTPPFDAENLTDLQVIRRIQAGEYWFPNNSMLVSTEELLEGLLEVNPDRRLSLEQMYYHSALNNSALNLPTQVIMLNNNTSK